MVDGDSGAGVCAAVCRVCERRNGATGGDGSAVWGLCGVAAGVAAGRGAGGADWILEEAVSERSDAESADGPATTGTDEPARRADPGQGESGGAERVAGGEPSGRGDAVHDVAGELADAAGEVQRTERYRSGSTDRGTDTC